MSVDAYEFYPCLVDRAPASIYVNLRYESERPTEAATRYWAEITMLDPGPHAIGTAAEADVLDALELAAIKRLGARGLIYVGRVRNRGTWEMTFYGPASHHEAIDEVARDAAPARRTETGSQLDPDWSYYRELLLPDDERRQWMDDRRLVDVFREQGDRLVTPRRVDHWAQLASAAARDAFITTATQRGFTVAATSEDDGDRPFGVQVSRIDPIELDHIHDVVMILVDAAVQHGGEYDGWETSIETA